MRLRWRRPGIPDQKSRRFQLRIRRRRKPGPVKRFKRTVLLLRVLAASTVGLAVVLVRL